MCMTKNEAADILENFGAIMQDSKLSKAIEMATKQLRKESTVSLDVFNQVCWERDMAIGQLKELIDRLKELGYKFDE